MKKRQELATQMGIEAVKDVREEISGYERKKNLMFYNIKHTGITDFSIELYFTPKPKINDAHRSEMILMNITYLKIYYDFKYGYIVIEDSFGGWQNVKIPIDFGVKTHIVYTRKGLMYTGYKNGEYVTSLTKKENCIDFAGFELKSTGDTYYTNEEYYNIRIFNYALSQSEVTALYNNGKPEEYVLPSKYKYDIVIRKIFNLHQTSENPKNILFTTNGNNFHISWSEGGSNKTRPTVSLGNTSEPDEGTNVLVEFEYSINKGVLHLQSISNTHLGVNLSGNGKFSRIIKTDTQRTIYARFDGSTYSNVSADISDISLRKCICIAEYLPQNLISTSDGEMNATTAIKWLDSAKQLPDNDEYLEPLLESIGGYDLTASGEPEIVYKPNVVQFWDLLDGIMLENGPYDTVASISTITNGVLLNYVSGGNELQYPRLLYKAISGYNAVGKRIKVEYDYKVIQGNPKIQNIETIGAVYRRFTGMGDSLIGTGHKIHTSLEIGSTIANTLRLNFGQSNTPYSVEITNVRVSYWNE